MDWAVVGIRRDGPDLVVRIRNHSERVIRHLEVRLGLTMHKTEIALLAPGAEVEARLELPNVGRIRHRVVVSELGLDESGRWSERTSRTVLPPLAEFDTLDTPV